MITKSKLISLKLAVFTLGLSPLLYLFYRLVNNRLGANPIEFALRALGEYALVFLVITLSITPLRVILKKPWLLSLRRMLGLFTFFYASLHLLAYAGWDQGFNLADILKDTAKRPFVFLGVAAWLLLLPLALTSFNRAIRALGARRWQALHRLVYLIAVLAPLHFIWLRLSKNNLLQPALYAAVLAGLLAWRVWYKLRTAR